MYKKYEVEIKVVQEQWLQLKMKTAAKVIGLQHAWKLLCSGRMGDA